MRFEKVNDLFGGDSVSQSPTNALSGDHSWREGIFENGILLGYHRLANLWKIIFSNLKTLTHTHIGKAIEHVAEQSQERDFQSGFCVGVNVIISLYDDEPLIGGRSGDGGVRGRG